jgi:periplasmic protein TonB
MLLLAEQNRAFGYAATASLALHALVLSIQVPLFRDAERAAPEPPLVAYLVEPAPPAAAAPPPLQGEKREPPKPVAASKPKPKPKPKSKPPPKPIARAKPEPAPVVTAPPAEEAAKQEPIEAPAAPPAPPAPAAPPMVAYAPPAVPASDPANELARYRQQLVAVAARHKRYPRIALDNGWTGDVVVRIEVAANGAVSSIKVKTSSGYEVLDAQALEMFGKAAPQVAVPAPLRGKPFSVEVRAIYNLKDRPS